MRALASGLLFYHFGLGAPSPLQPLEARDSTNCNTATNRACWISGSYDINTDYESNTPLTGNVRQVSWICLHNFEDTNDGSAVSPDSDGRRQLAWS